MIGPLGIKKKHREYGFEVMFISKNIAVKLKHHTPQRFGNEHFENEVGDVHWYVPHYCKLIWE